MSSLLLLLLLLLLLHRKVRLGKFKTVVLITNVVAFSNGMEDIVSPGSTCIDRLIHTDGSLSIHNFTHSFPQDPLKSGFDLSMSNTCALVPSTGSMQLAV